MRVILSQLDVAGEAHVGVDAAVRTAFSPPLLLGLIDLHSDTSCAQPTAR